MDLTHDHASRRHGLLYPMMVIAAVSVIVFSVLGIATMMGLLPSAFSGYRPETAPSRGEKSAPAPEPAKQQPASHDALAPCINCGVVASVRAIERPGQDGLLGAVAGGVVGGLLGNQVGHGNGRAAATVVGAGAGAYAGNQIEKNMHRRITYQIRVRMSDGRYHTFYQAAPPGLKVGEEVRVVKGRIVAG